MTLAVFVALAIPATRAQPVTSLDWRAASVLVAKASHGHIPNCAAAFYVEEDGLPAPKVSGDCAANDGTAIPATVSVNKLSLFITKCFKRELDLNPFDEMQAVVGES